MSEETIYAVRRLDGEPIFGDYGWMTVGYPGHWEEASMDSEHDDDEAPEVEYEMVKMTVEHVASRTFKNGEPLDGQPVNLELKP